LQNISQNALVIFQSTGTNSQKSALWSFLYGKSSSEETDEKS